MICDPFPHSITHHDWHAETLLQARVEFEMIRGWQEFRNDREHKNAITFGAARDQGAETCWEIREYLASPGLVGRLEFATGIKGLQFDELGGGLHEIPVGGYLNVHTDFNRDDQGRFRRVNLLLYLNPGWRAEWGGQLELWDVPEGHRCAEEESCVHVVEHVAPELGTQVIFVCSDRSWHGHPKPNVGPMARRSLAAYYFTEDPPPGYTEPHDTVFLER